jgi:hypothetical protein
VGMIGCPGEHFKPLFEWLFPKKLEKFQNVVPELLSYPHALNMLLKFWYLLVKPETSETGGASRIRRKDHSADGVVLFQYSAVVMMHVFNMLRNVSCAGNDAQTVRIKAMKYTMGIMAELLHAEYVMFGAFEFYGDQVLSKLLASFTALMNEVDIDDLFEIVKLGRALMTVVRSLTAQHLMVVLTKEAGFFGGLIGIICRGYEKSDVCTVNLAVESAKNLADFLVANKEQEVISTAVESNHAQLTKLAKLAWDYLCNFQEVRYANQMFLKLILIIKPETVENIYRQLRPQMPVEDLQSFESVFGEIQELLPSLETVNEKIFSSLLTKFRVLVFRKNLIIITH